MRVRMAQRGIAHPHASGKAAAMKRGDPLLDDDVPAGTVRRVDVAGQCRGRGPPQRSRCATQSVLDVVSPEVGVEEAYQTGADLSGRPSRQPGGEERTPYIDDIGPQLCDDLSEARAARQKIVAWVLGYRRSPHDVDGRSVKQFPRVTGAGNDNRMLDVILLCQPPCLRREIGADAAAQGRVELGDVEELQRDASSS